MNKNRNIQKAITFFLVTVIVAVGLFITEPRTVEAASGSLYLVANHHTSQFDAWAIKPGGTAEYQASYSLSHATDPAGIAIDESSKTLFVTSEFSGGVEMVDATTMTSLGASSGPSNLAGIAIDDANDLVYAIYRNSNQLYVFDWDPGTGTLTVKAGLDPVHLPGCSGAFGIALDEIRGILWVADSAAGTVRAYDVETWTEDTSLSFTASHKPVDVAVDRIRSLVYTVSVSFGVGVPGGCGSNLLSRYDLRASTETTVDLGHQGVGVAVDELTGYVYVTGDYYAHRLEAWDTSTTPWTQVQAVTVSGSPAGICIPQEVVAYNPLGLSKDDGLNDGQCISPGEDITYEICYDNVKNAFDVHNVIIVDELPANTSFKSCTGPGAYDPSTHTVTWDIGTLTAGAPQQCIQLVVSVEPDVVPGITLVDYVTIDSDDTPPTTLTESTDVCPLPTEIALTVSVIPKPPADGEYYKVGQDIEFDVTVHNPTDFDAYEVKLTAMEPPRLDIEDGWFATPWGGKKEENIPAGETRSTIFESEAIENGENIEVIVNAWGITDLYEAGKILGTGSYSLNIHPEEGPDWSFAIITDLHIGYNSEPWDSDDDGYEEIDYAGKGWSDGEPLQEDNYDEVTKRSKYAVETIIAEKDYYNIKFVMVLGDVSDTAELSEFLTAREILSELNGAGIPYIPLFGNHDTWPYAQDKTNSRHYYSSIAECAIGDQFFKEVFWGEANNENKVLIDNLFGGSWDHTYDEPVDLKAGILECRCYDFTLQTDDGKYFVGEDLLFRDDRECNSETPDYYLHNYGFTYNGITFICLDQVPRLGEDKELWNGNALPGALKGLIATDHEQTVDFSRKYYETYPLETAVLFSHYPTDSQSIDSYLLTPRQRLVSPSDGPEHAYWFAGHVHWQKDSGVSKRYSIASEDVAGIGLDLFGIEIPYEEIFRGERNGKTIRIVQIDEGELDYSTVLKPIREVAIKWSRPLLEVIWPWKSLPEPGTEITFTARCASYYGFSTSFDWDFGDASNTSSLWPSVTHSYSAEGDYNVTVTITTKDLTTGEETTQSTTRTLCVRNKHLISPLPSDLNATSLITEEDLTQIPKNTYQPALIAKQTSEGLPIGRLGVHFEEANGDIDLSTLVAAVDPAEAKSVLYMPSWPEEIEDYKTLLIPSTGVGTVYICLDATSLGEVSSENADIVMNVGETKDGMTIATTFYNDREYYLVSGVTGTGGGEIIEETSGLCFIATAAYGTPMAEETQILREFRDEYLLTNPLGQALVDIYYKLSPPIANFITEHPSLKPIVRVGLLPAVTMSTVIVNTSPAEKIAIVGLLVLVSVAVAILVTRRRGRGSEYT